MKKIAIAFAVLALAGGAAFAAQRRAGASDEAPSAEPINLGDAGQPWYRPDRANDATYSLPTVNTVQPTEWAAHNQAETAAKEDAMAYVPQPNQAGNLKAMQEAIAAAEGTANQGDPFRVCFGYKHTIRSLADHPAVTGEWRGEPLSDAICAGAGFGPGCVSTAAGKYQIIKPTWLACKLALRLPDFSPASQDRACAWLIERRGAMPDLVAGRFAAAVKKMRKEWASLPAAGYGQGERSLEWLAARFEQAGGVVTA